MEQNGVSGTISVQNVCSKKPTYAKKLRRAKEDYMNAKLDTTKCISCGVCASIAPDLFTVETGIVSFKKDSKTWVADDWTKAKEAAAACPAEVIEITE